MFRKPLLLIISATLVVITTIYFETIAPDCPRKFNITLNDQTYTFKLPVLHQGNDECLIDIPINDTTVKGTIMYKKYNVNEPWKEQRLISMSGSLVSVFPNLNSSLKFEYYIKFITQGKSIFLANDKPVVLRFEKKIPKYISFPMRITLFLGLIFAVFAGALTVYHIDSYQKYTKVAFWFYFSGGFVLNIAATIWATRKLFVWFDINNDLSVYQYLAVFMLWGIAYWCNKKLNFKWGVLAIAIITLAIYYVPQSVYFP
jgi:hypothetical protein